MPTVTVLKIDRDEAVMRVGCRTGGPSWIFQPFDSGQLGFAATVVGDRIIAANEVGEVALFDPEARTCLGRSHIGRELKELQGLVSHDGRRAILYTPSGLAVVDCETLDVMAEVNGLVPRRSGQDFDLVREAPDNAGGTVQPLRIDPDPGLIEHMDGTLIGSCSQFEISPEKGAVLYGVIILDLEHMMATRLVAQAEQSNVFRNGFRWFSPSGQYGIRFHYGSLPFHNGRSSWRYADIINRILGRGGRHELPDCKLDGVERLGVALEVWTIKPLRPIAKLVTYMQPADETGRNPQEVQYLKDIARQVDFAGTMPGDPFPGEMNLRLSTIVSGIWRYMRMRIQCAAWEPDERAIWILIDTHHIRRIALEGQVSPLVTIPRVRDSRLNRFGGLIFDVQKGSLEPLGHNRVRLIRGGDQIVDVPLPHSAIGPTEILAVEESFAPGIPLDLSLSQTTSEELAYATRTFIDMPDLSEASVTAAIDSLTARIATAFPDMIHCSRSNGDYLRSAFLTPTHYMNERVFFDFVYEQCPTAAPSLRRLIEIFSSAAAPKKIHCLQFTDTEGALSHAALALARLDGGAVDALYAYITSPNVGQSPFIRDDIMPAYFQHHGWKGEAGIRLGVRFAVYEEFYGAKGVAHAWYRCGLREAARQLSPAVFAAMLAAERKIPKREIDMAEVVTAWLGVLQDSTDEFDSATKSALMEIYWSNGPNRIARIRDTIAFIEETGHGLTWRSRTFRLLEVRNAAHDILSARDFGDLIVTILHSRVETLGDDRFAAKIIHDIRSISESFDATNAYDSEVIQILRTALNGVIAGMRPVTAAGLFAQRLLAHLEGIPKGAVHSTGEPLVGAVIDELCLVFDASIPFDAEVIGSLREASKRNTRLEKPWNWMPRT